MINHKKSNDVAIHLYPNDLASAVEQVTPYSHVISSIIEEIRFIASTAKLSIIFGGLYEHV